MNYQSVKIFLAIVEHRSISAAARALYLTQPAVSGHLNRLEEELGCPLILRQKGVQQITLTSAGKAFVPVATQWIDAEKAVLRFKESCSQKTLKLATGVTAHDYMTASIIQKLLLRNPELNLNLQFIDPIRLFRHPVDAIMNRDVDVLLYYGSTLDSPLITSVPFFQEEYLLLCRTDSSLPEGTVTPEMLDPAFEIAQEFPNQSLNKWHQEHFPDAPQPYASVVSTVTMFLHFQDKRCWAIAPTTIAMLMVQQNPEKFTLRTLQPSPTRQHAISIMKGYPHSDVIDDLLVCCREYLAERPYLQSLLPEDIKENNIPSSFLH